jgi:peptide/nickel transport system permease protein
MLAMIRFLVRHLLLTLPILIGITVITFGIIHLTPGGFTSVHMDMNPNVSNDQ